MGRLRSVCACRDEREADYGDLRRAREALKRDGRTGHLRKQAGVARAPGITAVIASGYNFFARKQPPQSGSISCIVSGL